MKSQHHIMKENQLSSSLNTHRWGKAVGQWWGKCLCWEPEDLSSDRSTYIKSRVFLPVKPSIGGCGQTHSKGALASQSVRTLSDTVSENKVERVIQKDSVDL